MPMPGVGESANNKKTGKKLWRPLPGTIIDADVRSIGAETTHTTLLIVHFAVKLKLLILQGKNYLWPRPDVCPCCGGRHLWGHGYTARYFDGYPGLIWLKRYRCVDCQRVHTLRPKTHWRRFQAASATIIQSLRFKIEHHCWLNPFSRQRQQYWMQGFTRQSRVIHPSDGRHAYQRLKDLLARNVIAATHSLKWRQITAGMSFNFVPAM